MAFISTKDLEPAAVLKALYDHSQPLGMGFLRHIPGPMDIEEARRLMAGKDSGDYPAGPARPGRYFDYLYGRLMKVDLSDPMGFDGWLYDRDNGQGAATRAIDTIRT